MDSEALLSIDRIILALTQRGAVFEGAHRQASALARQAMHVALRHCEKVVEDSAIWFEKTAPESQLSSTLLNRLTDYAEPQRPPHGLFSVEMEAGLDLGPSEGSRVRGRSIPPYLALRSWVASRELRRPSRQLFRAAEVGRWMGQLSLPGGGRKPMWRRVPPDRHAALADAVYAALGAFIETEPPPSGEQVFEHLLNAEKIVKRNGRHYFAGVGGRPVDIKAVRAAVRRRIQVLGTHGAR